MSGPPAGVALIAEYPWRFGGAQRLLATLADRWSVPVYEPASDLSSLVWDTSTVPALPDAAAVFSVVVDSRRLQVYQDRVNVKMCHSAATVAALLGDARIREVTWVTHRRAVFEFCRAEGLRVVHIEDGYIPFTSPRIPSGIARTPDCAIVGRLSPDRVPFDALDALAALGRTVHILGSSQNRDHLRGLRRRLPSNCVLYPDDVVDGVSDNLKSRVLASCTFLIHVSSGGLRDGLEYAILDGLSHGCIPLCVSPEERQFASLVRAGLGVGTTDVTDLPNAVSQVAARSNDYAETIAIFVSEFMGRQAALMDRWAAGVAQAARG